MAQRVIVDVDAGVDDYLALLLLLHGEKCGKIKIEAIVCTNGNTTIDNVCKNVVRLLEVTNRTDIPVYRGSSQPLIPLTQKTLHAHHGADGFGDLQHASTPDLTIIKKEPAAVGIADLVLRNPHEISLICVGPLTNAALAIRLYDDFAEALRDMWIMGGNHTARGNSTAAAEFNFYIDPEAAHIVLDTVKKPIYILTWESCQLPKIPIEWRFEVFGAKKNPEIQLLNKAEVDLPRQNKKIWFSCDAFLAAAFLYPDTIIRKKSRHHASVELHGSQTRGQMVLDYLKVKEENITLIEEFEVELFKQLLMEL